MTTFLLGLFIKNLLFKIKSVGLSHCHNSHTEKELNGMEWMPDTVMLLQKNKEKKMKNLFSFYNLEAIPHRFSSRRRVFPTYIMWYSTRLEDFLAVRMIESLSWPDSIILI